jgi:hypothetical protein
MKTKQTVQSDYLEMKVTKIDMYMVLFLFNTVIYVFLLLCLIVRLYTNFMFMYSLYVYVSPSCQLALFDYPAWGFSVLFPQL